MPVCIRCKSDKNMFDFGFISKKSRYDTTCKFCRSESRKTGEWEKLKATWDALAGRCPCRKPRKK